MGKLLSWLVLVALVYLGLRLIALSRRRRERAAAGRARREAGDPAARAQVGGEMMVRCAHCGVHLPASEAISAGGRTYCDRAHRDADLAAQARR